jgi:tetratricopeptide (TPR) repeat protein
MFYPLTLTMFWVEHALWGLDPLPYHLVNVLLHATSAVLLWRVLLSLRITGAWLGAALWAFHPVMVESVAWISEMKNSQSGVFYLLAILFFVRWINTTETLGPSHGRWNYVIALLFAAMAILSKSSTVILPAVLLLCAWWLRGRCKWRDIAEVAPMIVMAIVSGVITTGTQTPSVSLGLLGVQTWSQKLATAGDVTWFYLGKLIWPYPLIAYYPHWNIDSGDVLSYLPSVIVAGVLVTLWLYRQTWGRPAFFAFSYFLIAALPVLGFAYIDYFSYSFVADHFQYLPSIGPLALAGAALGRWVETSTPSKVWLPISLCSLLLLTLALLSWQRAWVFESDETVWTDTLEKNPDCWVAHNDVGTILVHSGRVEESIVEFKKALELNPTYAEGHNNLGHAFVCENQLDAAIEQFRVAVKIDPNYFIGYYDLGSALSQKGQIKEGIIQLQKSLEINPDSAEAHNNLGTDYFLDKQPDLAGIEFEKAVQLKPDYVDAHCNLGVFFEIKGQKEKAFAELRKALELDPNSTHAKRVLSAFLTHSQTPAPKQENHTAKSSAKHP